MDVVSVDSNGESNTNPSYHRDNEESAASSGLCACRNLCLQSSVRKESNGVVGEDSGKVENSGKVERSV